MIRQVFVVLGGCFGDEHIIAIYQQEQQALIRADLENSMVKGLGAYVERWPVE